MPSLTHGPHSPESAAGTEYARNLREHERKVLSKRKLSDPGRILDTAWQDFLLLICPVWVAITYLGLVAVFPEHRAGIFFLYLLVLGEMHFAATWLFFTDRANRSWVLERLPALVVIPAALIVLYVAIGLMDFSMAVFLGSVFSAVHVTRQSMGVFRLFGGGKDSVLEYGIYVMSLFWLGIGFIRFFAPNVLGMFRWPAVAGAMHEATPFLVAVAVVVGIGYLGYAVRQAANLSVLFVFLTGAFLYSPYAFVQVPQDAVVMGVGMHWCQYVALTSKLYLRPEQSVLSGRIKIPYGKIIFLLAYAAIAASIQTNTGSSLSSASLLVLIPLSLQAYHYYIDAFIWKFSDPYIRKHIGGRLFRA